MKEIEEDKIFLHREKGIPGCMLVTDRNLTKRKKRALVNKQKFEKRRKISKMRIEQFGKSC
jgi:hypothetical protein